MKKFIVITLCIGMFLIPAFARAAILTFDDIEPPLSSGIVPYGYGGLNWDHIRYINGPSAAPNSGYTAGRVSGDYVAFNENELVTRVTNGNFDFNGAWLTGAWNDDLNIRVVGTLSGIKLYDRTVVVNSTSPTWFQFDFLRIDTLYFDSFGGTQNPNYPGNGTFWAMDNFTYNIPESSTLLLLGSGLAGLVGYRRRRCKK